MIARHTGRYLAAAFVAANMVWAGAAAADDHYDTRLLAVAFDGATKANVQGDGHADAVLNGNKLSVSGSFTALPSAATNAHLYMGVGIGIPGDAIFDLAVTGTKDGSFSGNFTLDRKQLTAFRQGHVYVQINSQKAPDGNLWGWLLPAHPTVAADVPQAGHAFLPQLDVPGNWTQK